MNKKELETLAGIALCQTHPEHYLKENMGYERMIGNCVEHLRKNAHKCKKSNDEVKRYLLIVAKHYYILQDHVCKIRQLGYAFYRMLRAQGIEV